MTAENDSTDLEALFDSIAASAPEKVAEPPKSDAVDDTDDLQALFDSVSSDYTPPAAASAAIAPAMEAPASDLEEGAGWPVQEAVFQKIGVMARQLHDTIRELGYDKVLEKTVTAIPDAKDRLAYVANLTEQAACRVLNATDVANPLVDKMESTSKDLGGRWDRVFAADMDVDEFKKLATETREFFGNSMPTYSEAMRAQLTEIMMAQDFQDLTGQVIKKIVLLAQDLENGLMNVLVEVVPDEKRTEEVASLMNGPVIKADGKDVVVNQQQVDDLLDSLGF